MPSRTPRKRSTTTQKGLGHHHQVVRERLMLRHVDGTKCWWCSRPMFRDKTRNWDGRSLHADHDTARSRGGTTATRLLHAACNEERGDGSRDHRRPTATTTPDPRDVDPLLGNLVMDWP